MKRFQGLQVLRAVAVLFVIWTHLRFGVGNSDHPLIATTAGAVGVDIFFVLSGFIIAHSASDIKTRGLEFMLRRLARVIPLYYLLSLYFLPMALGDFSRLWNSFLFLPLFDLTHLSNPLHEFGWTLCFEVWFYVVFAVALCFAGARLAWAYTACFLGVGAALIYCFYRGSWFFPAFAFNPMVIQFVFGVLIYKFRTRIGRRLGCIAAVSAILLFIAVFETTELGWYSRVLSDRDLSLQRGLIWGGFAACLVVVILALENMNFSKWPAWGVYIGDASFSIYLIQPFAIRATRRLVGGGWLGGVIFVTLSIVSGCLIYFLVEKKMSRWARLRVDNWFMVWNGRLGVAKSGMTK